MVSVNESALPIVHEMIKLHEQLQVNVQKDPSGAIIIDAGIKTKGGFIAGKYLSEVCLGGLATLRIDQSNFKGLNLPTVHLYSDFPVISTLGSQFAGWNLKHKEGSTLGSGPARAIALKPKKLYQDIQYSDQSKQTMVVLETDKTPPREVITQISEKCNVKTEDVYVLAAPTSSIAGSVQISARVLEVGIHRLYHLGFPVTHIKYGEAKAPIAPIHPKSVKAMGRTNDMIMYGGTVTLFVDSPDNLDYNDYLGKATTNKSKDYGKPFFEIFKAAEYDFYKVDPGMFSVAELTINDLQTGRTYHSGEINSDILKKSINYSKI
jgi:methenyltetrahydromethanopterin cyclohydrolase